jgi:hypothetical protein
MAAPMSRPARAVASAQRMQCPSEGADADTFQKTLARPREDIEYPLTEVCGDRSDVTLFVLFIVAVLTGTMGGVQKS